MTVTEKSNEKTAVSVSAKTIVINIVLALLKLIGGILGASAAMLSDAVHTISDVASTIVVVIGVKLSAKSPDDDHQYGHERFECVAAIVLSVMLFATGAGIGCSGLFNIVSGNYAKLEIPGLISLVMSVVSIVVKEIMYWYTRAAAKKINSGALMADAWHHRSDALSSVGSFAGILGARHGFPILDSVACLVICVFVIRASVIIFVSSIGKMTDKACDGAQAEEIRRVILSEPEVLGIDLMRTRVFGERIYVDVEISVDGGTLLRESHGVAQRVHDAIEGRFPDVKHCMVHVNPRSDND